MLSSILQKRYQQCQHLFERWYPDFRNAGQRYQDLIAASVDPHTTLLDIGCGRDSLASDQIRTAGYSVGIDLSLSDLKENTSVQHSAMADAGNLPFPDAHFDLLISQWTVEHLADPQGVFCELARVLRPHGRIILFTTNAHNYIPLISRLVPDGLQRVLIETLLRRPTHESHPTVYRANTHTALVRLAAGAGLCLEECIYVGNPFYLGFSPLLFRLALLYERVTDLPPLQGLKLYVLVVLSKPDLKYSI